VTIGPRYFEVLGLPLLRGRTFTALDGVAGRENAIVSQRFVDMFLPGADPIGSRIRLSNPREPGAAPLQATIVGVSPTLRQQFMAEIGPVVYVPYRASPTASARLMVRSRSNPAAITSLVREELRALDPDLPLNSLVPLDVMMAQSRWGHRVFGTMFLVFAGVALLLAAIGLYALTAYAVSQRTQEIGVRMALGAQTRQVVWLFMGRTMWQLAAGLALGLGGAYGIGRLVRSMLVSTSPTDPLTMISIAVLLAVVALAACWLPARRATRLDPVIALRYE
jgi:putative ABC transport system permease protein